jgi:hypothetical protein
MSKPIAADWDLIKSLILKGLTPRQVSEQTGVSYEAIRKRGQREGWDKEKSQIAHYVSQAVAKDVTEGQRNYLNRVINLGNKVLDALERQDKFSLDDLETVAGVITKLDPVQRRALGLDTQENNAPRTSLVQVVVQSAPGTSTPLRIVQTSATSAATIDVEADTQQNSDSDSSR